MAKSRTKAKQAADYGQWSSPWVFVLAASGAAIGLNNIWHFPFLVGEYGGGAFIIVYLFCVLLIGMPLLIAEVMLGHCARRSPVNSIRLLAEQSKHHRHWGLVGAIGMIAGFLILSYLSVIAGWIMAYAVRFALGMLDGLTADGVHSLFTAFISDPEKQLLWHSLFMVMTIFVAARGVKAGLEPVVKYAAPLFLALMVILLIYVMVTGEFAQAYARLLHPDFTKLTRVGILAALAHAFFSLGLGIGAMLIYGAYLQDKASVPKLSLAAAGIDTLVAIVGGLVVLSVLLAVNIEPVWRAELVFQALPVSFDQLPLGRLMGTLFFASIVLTAWLSGFALIEPLIAWLGETWKIPRLKAAIGCGIGAWSLGIVTVLSFNYWESLEVVKNLGPFDLLQITTSAVLLPVSGILVAFVTGWILRSELTRAAFDVRSPCAYDVWLWSVRVITPVLIFIVFLNASDLFL